MNHDTPSAAPRQSGSGWTVRIPSTAKIGDIEPTHLKMLLVLEGACRTKSYCWHSNASLASMYGSKLSGGFRRMLADMEAAGYFWRLAINPARPTDGRAGIFLHRRLDPDLPVEEVPPPAEAVKRLWASRNHASKEATPLPQSGQPPLPQLRQQNEDVFSNEEEKNVRTSYDDLFDLSEKAQKRFGVSGLLPRVRDAVGVYGLEWVTLAIETPKLKGWGGVLGTLKNWKAEGGPVVKVKPAPSLPPWKPKPLNPSEPKPDYLNWRAMPKE